MNRNRQLVRVLKLMALIRGRNVCQPLGELATILGVSTRTVRRDLEALGEAHLVVPPFERDMWRDDRR